MRGGDYEEFTDRLFPVAKLAAWIGGFVGLLLLAYFFYAKPAGFSNPRAHRLLFCPIVSAAIAWLTVAGAGFLFAPRAVFESYKGQELMGKFGTTSVLLARVAIFLHLALVLGLILGFTYRVIWP